MSEPKIDRQLPITQIDELWQIASKRWGDPGRRTPPPDNRFTELRGYLTKIEGLFEKDKVFEPKSPSTNRFGKRKIAPSGYDSSEYSADDDEIPF